MRKHFLFGPFEDLKLGIFETKLGSEKSKSFDKIHTLGVKIEDCIKQEKFARKFMVTNKNYLKKFFFLFQVLMGGVTKIQPLKWVVVKKFRAKNM
jgi:hypothetical protein